MTGYVNRSNLIFETRHHDSFIYVCFTADIIVSTGSNESRIGLNNPISLHNCW